MSGVVDGTRWMGGVSNVWAENGGEVEAELQAMTTEGGVEIQRVREREDGFAIRHPGGGLPQSNASSPESGALVGPGPRAARPRWPEAAPLHFQQDDPKLWNRLTPTP